MIRGALVQWAVLGLEHLGRSCLRFVASLGRISKFGAQICYWMAWPPYRPHLFMEQLYFIGNKSVFIILLSGAFTGMVLAYQTYFGFRLINVDSLVGPVVGISLARELAPVLSGLIVAGRAGGAMAARIGTMKVTEQIDALEVMGINSIQYLAVPRVLAASLSLPILSTIFLFVGAVGAYLVGTMVLMIEKEIFYQKLQTFMVVDDIIQGLVKALCFGLIISLVGTYFGFQVTKGAAGVGKGTNLAVVWGMILILVTDYFLTSVLMEVF